MRLGGHHSRDQPADQPRPGSHRDQPDVGETRPGLLHCLLHRDVQTLGMGAGGNLGHHATEGLVQRRLSDNHRGLHRNPIRVTAHDGGGGVVATRFDAQHRQRRKDCLRHALAGNTGGMGETTKAAPAATLLLTRPEPQSRDFLGRIEAQAGMSLPHLISPLAEIAATGAAVPATGTLMLTSGRGVEAAGAALRGRQVYCVGPATAARAREAGASVLAMAPDLDALIAVLLDRRPADLIHLRGTHTTGDPTARLQRGRDRADRDFASTKPATCP